MTANLTDGDETEYKNSAEIETSDYCNLPAKTRPSIHDSAAIESSFGDQTEAVKLEPIYVNLGDIRMTS